MKLPTQIAGHLRAVYFGGNWTSVNLMETLANISWKVATTQVYSLNSIAALVYHMNYYIVAITQVLKGKPLEASDKFSFDFPAIQSQEDWENFLEKTGKEAEEFAQCIEQLEENKLDEIFVIEKYGSYYRNLHGVIEHLHYHLGQIVLLKKIILQLETTRDQS